MYNGEHFLTHILRFVALQQSICKFKYLTDHPFLQENDN